MTCEVVFTRRWSATGFAIPVGECIGHRTTTTASPLMQRWQFLIRTSPNFRHSSLPICPAKGICVWMAPWLAQLDDVIGAHPSSWRHYWITKCTSNTLTYAVGCRPIWCRFMMMLLLLLNVRPLEDLSFPPLSKWDALVWRPAARMDYVRLFILRPINLW